MASDILIINCFIEWLTNLGMIKVIITEILSLNNAAVHVQMMVTTIHSAVIWLIQLHYGKGQQTTLKPLVMNIKKKSVVDEILTDILIYLC